MLRFALLNTRPVHQAGTLAQRVTAAGGASFSCPALQIVPIAFSGVERLHWMSELQRSDLWVVTSANAVPPLLDWVQAFAPQKQTKQVLAIGEATHQALQQRMADYLIYDEKPPKIEKICQNPQSSDRNSAFLKLLPPLHLQKGEMRADSETLLQHPVWQQLSPKSTVAVVKGVGGRDYLLKALLRLGFEGIEVPLYRREALPFCVETWQAFAQVKVPRIILATSFESLQALWSGWQDIQRGQGLRGLPVFDSHLLLAFSPRIADLAKAEGWQGEIVCAEETSNMGVMRTIERMIKDGL